MKTDWLRRLAIAATTCTLMLGWPQVASGVGSHRSAQTTWSYTPSGPPIDIEFSTSLDVVSDLNNVSATLNVDATTDFDLFAEYSIYSRGVVNQQLRNDLGRGEPFSEMWGWTMARKFSGTYTNSYSIEVPLYFTNGKESFLALGDVVAKFRFIVRYMDGTELVQSGWYRTETVEYDSPDDVEPPVFTSAGTLTALNFSFGAARSLVLVADLQCEDQPAGYNYTYSLRATSQLTGTSFYQDATSVFNKSGRGTCKTGAGLISSTIVAKFTKTVQTLVAEGDYLWDCEVILWDAQENASDWTSIGTVDLRDFD